MSILVISTSLNPKSRSRVLARHAHSALLPTDPSASLLDLAPLNLPMCDGKAAYSHPAVTPLANQIRAASAVILASPVYNYDASASAKNMIELTGKAWTGKLVGFLATAGGTGSYMAPMQLANSLMLDFRCLIIPRFVYALGAAFDGERISDPNIADRVEQLAAETHRLSRLLFS